jgi:hypothetical protein
LDYRKVGYGNIAIRGKYGKNHDKQLLYCKTCGSRFATTLNTPLHRAHLSIDQIHQIILLTAKGSGVRAISRALEISAASVIQTISKVDNYCETILNGVMSTLQLTDDQMNGLWIFIKNRHISKSNRQK